MHACTTQDKEAEDVQKPEKEPSANPPVISVTPPPPQVDRLCPTPALISNPTPVLLCSACDVESRMEFDSVLYLDRQGTHLIPYTFIPLLFCCVSDVDYSILSFSDITGTVEPRYKEVGYKKKNSYNKVILLVPALNISVFLPWYNEKPDITR